MSGDGSPWRSGAADFDAVGFSLVKRDIEVLMLAVQELAKGTVNEAAVTNILDQYLQNTNTVNTLNDITNQYINDNRLPWHVNEGGTGAISLTGYIKGDGTNPFTAQTLIPWSDISGVPAPSGSVTVNTNTSDTTDSAALTISGTFAAQSWTLYEKHPRFNAKWLLGAPLGASAGTVSSSSAANLFLWWNKTTQVYEPFTMYASTTVGLVNCYDPAAPDTNGKMTSCAAGTAISVFGRSANSAGVPSAIAGAANQVLACNGTPALAFSRTITLGDTSNAGSITIGNATSATAIVISPTLVNAAGKVLSVREIDVCDAGVAKKMLVLASAPY